jgi:hypothetical protein
MQDKGISQIIARLEQIKLRPHMWLERMDAYSCEHFLRGFRDACFGLGYEVPLEIREQVTLEHGWQRSKLGVVPSMKRRGLSEPEIVEALLELETAFWKCLRERSI